MADQLSGAALYGEVERRVTRLGPAASLVPDTYLIARNMVDYSPAALAASSLRSEVSVSVRWLCQEPLMTALQGGRAAAAAVQCQHCQPAEPPKVLYRNYSGSSAEGLTDLIMGEKGGTSDYDIMFEFGASFRWVAEPVREAEPDCISTEAAPKLWAKPASSPGFVTLYWTRTSRCSHEAPLAALPADSMRGLMHDFCRAKSDSDSEITCSGPAVNVRPPGADDGGRDHVPCLRLLWWPEAEDFLSRHRVTDFPPVEARRDICRYGVHLVPTGRPGSATEQVEYRVSFSRAEVVTVRHLSPVQHEAIRTTKGLKNMFKESGEPTIKSYYIKTAVLWLAQDQPSERWTGVTDSVKMVLDWLEHHLSAGNLPCLFWPSINLVAGLSTEELDSLLTAVYMMRQVAPRFLLLCCCERRGWDVEDLLEGGWEPLTEQELRVRLTRELVMDAVLNNTTYRPTAACWEHWIRCHSQVLPHASEQQLLHLLYHCGSGTYRQQCALLVAVFAAPADVVSRMWLKPVGGGMFTWSVTPLLDLLNEQDLVFLLGEPAAVTAWCRQQLRRPPAERPTGLTAEFDTAQGRSELLMQPELLLRAVREAALDKLPMWDYLEQDLAKKWEASYPRPDTYQQCREDLEETLSCDLESWLREDLPELDGPTVTTTARLWRQNMQNLLSGDRLREAHTAVTARCPDRWQLRQYIVRDSSTEGKTRRRRCPKALTQTNTHLQLQINTHLQLQRLI